MTDAPPGPPPPLRVVEPTRMAERTILLIAAVLSGLAAGALLFLGLKHWEAGNQAEVIKALMYLGVGALLGLVTALLIQLAGTVGSKVQTHIGADGVSVDIDRSGP